MTQYLSVIGGILLFSFLGFLAASGLSQLYEMRLAKSQDDMDSFAVYLVLAVIPAFAIRGGVPGFLGHRRRARRSSGRSDT